MNEFTMSGIWLEIFYNQKTLPAENEIDEDGIYLPSAAYRYPA